MKTKDLKNLLAKLMRNSGKDDQMFSSINGEVGITSVFQAGTTHVRTCVRSNVDLGANFTIPAPDFKRFVTDWEKMGKEITFFEQGDEVFVSIDNIAPFSFWSKFENILFPMLIIPTTEAHAIPEGAEELKKILQKDEPRFALNHWYLSGGAGWASDGFRILILDKEKSTENAIAIPAFINPKDFTHAWEEKDCLVLSGDGIQVEYYDTQERKNFYKDSLRSYLDKLPSPQASVEITSAIPAVGTKVIFKFSEGKLTVCPQSSKFGKECDSYDVPMNFTSTGNLPENLALLTKFLDTGLQLIGPKFSCFTTPHLPAVFENSHYYYAVMPLNLD